MFKYASIYIRKNLIITILLIIQMGFLIFNLFTCSEFLIKFNSEKNQINHFFKDKLVYGIEPSDAISQRSMDITLGSSKIIKSYISNLKHKDFNLTLTDTFPCTISKFKGYENFKVIGPPELKNSFYVNSLMVNSAALNEFPFEIFKGRSFTEEELIDISKHSKDIPVILGHDFSGYLAIGDNIKIYETLNGVVVGILKPNQLNPGNIMSGNRFISLDKYIAIPDGYIQVGEYLTGAGLLLFHKNTSKEYINSISNDIRNEFKKLNSKVDVRDFTEDVNALSDSYLHSLKDSLMIATIITIFIFISFTIVILNGILIRKKEFAIHYLAGGTTSYIALRIIYELGIINVIAFIISTIALIFIDKAISIHLQSVFIVFACIVMLNTIILVLPIKTINKIKLSELIKGDD